MKKTPIHSAKIAQISENSLIHSVVEVLKGREAFIDTDEDLGERIYNADIFEGILSEIEEHKGTTLEPEVDKKGYEQLEELSERLGEYQYVQIVMI